MEKMRIISDNAIDSATVTATSTAGSLAASNMKSNKKSAVWRSTSTSATVTATFTQQVVDGVVLAFTNLTPGAQLRVKFFALPTDTSPVYDSGYVFGNPPVALGNFTWGDTLGENAYSGDVPLGVNNFQRGRYSYARVWADTKYLVQKVTVEIVDSSNVAGYLEVGKLVIGKSWSPETGTEFGKTDTTSVDSSDSVRSEAGDLIYNHGSVHRTMSLNFPAMAAEDRDVVWKILRNSSKTKPIFISVFPNNMDSTQEQTFMIYGSLSSENSLNIPFYNRFETSFNIEEI